MYHYHVETPTDMGMYTVDNMEDAQKLMRMAAVWAEREAYDKGRPFGVDQQPKMTKCVLGSRCPYDTVGEHDL